MASDTIAGPPGDGWQQHTLPVLAGLAARDDRISALRVHGSASAPAAGTDRWSDLDVLITTGEPVAVAEDLARQIGRCLSPVFAASRNGDRPGYCARLVLRDLRRIDITAAPAAEDDQRQTHPPVSPDPSETITELVSSFRFDAVLAAVKAARGDVLIGAHLTLQLARHVLVIAMLLRDRDAGTRHHRFGGSRWDAWITRLAAGPAPYTQREITAGIRSYTSNFMITRAAGTKLTCAEAAKALLKDERRGEVRSAGGGSNGERWYARAWLATASARHHLLIRRHLKTGDLAIRYCWVPEG